MSGKLFIAGLLTILTVCTIGCIVAAFACLVQAFSIGAAITIAVLVIFFLSYIKADDIV